MKQQFGTRDSTHRITAAIQSGQQQTMPQQDRLEKFTDRKSPEYISGAELKLLKYAVQLKTPGIYRHSLIDIRDIHIFLRSVSC